MSKQEEIIEIAGKRVEKRYTPSENEVDRCMKCCLHNSIECDLYLSTYAMRPCEAYHKRGGYAYFVEAERPIQGSIAPGADLEAEIERWWNERYANLKKGYKFDSTSGHYFDNEGIIDLARHFAEWERKRTLDKVVEWMKANLTYTHPRKGDEACMVNIPAFRDAMNEDNT